jgi:hypothetical protein
VRIIKDFDGKDIRKERAFEQIKEDKEIELRSWEKNAALILNADHTIAPLFQAHAILEIENDKNHLIGLVNCGEGWISTSMKTKKASCTFCCRMVRAGTGG